MELNQLSKPIILFALSFLKANFDDKVKELLADNALLGNLSGKVRVPNSKEEIEALIQVLLKGDLPDSQVKVQYVLRDDDLAFQEGDTLEDVLDAGGSLIAGCMEPPLALFKTEGDRRWLVASIECVINEANPAFVAEEIEARIAALEDELGTGDNETDLDEIQDAQERQQVREEKQELLFLRAELAKTDRHERRARAEKEQTSAEREHCDRCGVPFSEDSIGGGRCTNCGTMVCARFPEEKDNG